MLICWCSRSPLRTLLTLSAPSLPVFTLLMFSPLGSLLVGCVTDPTKASRGVEGHPPSSHLASGRSTPDSLIERMGGRQRSAGMSDAVSAAPKRASNVYGRLMKMQERSGGAATNSSPAQASAIWRLGARVEQCSVNLYIGT